MNISYLNVQSFVKSNKITRISKFVQNGLSRLIPMEMYTENKTMMDKYVINQEAKKSRHSI